MRYELVIFNIPCSGFIMNRVLGGAMHEAFWLLENNICSPEDLDTACTAGLNWPLGIARLADMIGLDVIWNSFQLNYQENKVEYMKPPEMLKDLVEKNKLGWKTGEGLYSYKKKDE
jgi:3-hydroxyacyl-CoA dehydrogenase